MKKKNGKGEIDAPTGERVKKTQTPKTVKRGTV